MKTPHAVGIKEKGKKKTGWERTPPGKKGKRGCRLDRLKKSEGVDFPDSEA